MTAGQTGAAPAGARDWEAMVAFIGGALDAALGEAEPVRNLAGFDPTMYNTLLPVRSLLAAWISDSAARTEPAFRGEDAVLDLPGGAA